MVRVLIVGAGLTGALCAHMLRRHLPTQLQCQIVVWEKSRGVGGRMSLSRPSEMEDCSAELGAQYVEQHTKYIEQHKYFYNELLESGILKPLEGKIDGFREGISENFTCGSGLNMMAKHFFAKSLVETCFNVRLDSLRLTSDDQEASWNVWEAATTSGKHDHFDAVFLTMPIPQILGIEGITDNLQKQQISDLEGASYSSRFAVGLFYEPGAYNIDLPYVAKFVLDNEVICFISVDQKKRGIERKTQSIVVHTSAPFGKSHLEEDAEKVGPLIIEELKKIIPDLPEPTYVKYHKWRYSQVTKATESSDGCLIPKNKPLLVLAGDGFTHSNFDGCVQSAIVVEKEISKWLSSSVL
uniref:renalase-like isoform X1 n=1 Tax=Styela clava TaxID=7725 RepID=UPI00193A713A|nr:renalase-like isoform X1 [Styela clava]